MVLQYRIRLGVRAGARAVGAERGAGTVVEADGRQGYSEALKGRSAIVR